MDKEPRYTIDEIEKIADHWSMYVNTPDYKYQLYAFRDWLRGNSIKAQEVIDG